MEKRCKKKFFTFESILNLWIHLVVVQSTKSVDVSLNNLYHFTPFGVLGRVLRAMWAACGQRQGTPLNELPAHCRARYEHLGVWALVQGNLSGALKVSSHFAYFYALKSLSWDLAEITIFFHPVNARATYSLHLSSSTLWGGAFI